MEDSNPASRIRLVGAVAGLGSGLTKVAVGHGFDTIKVRQQIHGSATGPPPSALNILRTIVRNEGVLALYKGASSPAVGWTAIDSLLLGSLHNYRLFLLRLHLTSETNPENGLKRLSLFGHGCAGLLAGLTSAILATPMELLKVNLQIQTHSKPSERQFKNPFDAARQIVKKEGPFGLWRGFSGSLIQRSCFFWMFLSVEVFMRSFSKISALGYEMNPGLANFLSGGFASFAFWIAAIGPDTVKNRMMAHPYPHPYSSPLTLQARPTFRGVARQIYAANGFQGFFRGLGPCLLRAFPVNASAYFVYEGIMSSLGAEKTRH